MVAIEKELMEGLQERLLVGPFQLVHRKDNDAHDELGKDVWVLPGSGSVPPEYAFVTDVGRRYRLAKANVQTATTVQLAVLAAEQGWQRPRRTFVAKAMK